MAFLDTTGLVHLWAKIVSVVGEKADASTLSNLMSELKDFTKKDLDTTLTTTTNTGIAPDSGAVAKLIAATNSLVTANTTNITTNTTNISNLTKRLDDNTDDFAKKTDITNVSNQISTTNESLSSHTGNKNNPHSVTKAQVGLGDVPNLTIEGFANNLRVATDKLQGLMSNSDKINLDKLVDIVDLTDTDTVSSVVSNAQSSAIEASNNYTDSAISNLVDGAPDTLNTLNELAAALKDNADIVSVLENAVAEKVDKTVAESTASSSNLLLTKKSVDSLINTAAANITSSYEEYALPLTGGTVTGDIIIKKNDPYLKLTNTEGGNDILGIHYYGTSTGNNTFGIYDSKNSRHLLQIVQSSGEVQLYKPLGIAYGGTGSTNASDARSALEVPYYTNGVVIVNNLGGIGTSTNEGHFWKVWNILNEAGDDYPVSLVPSQDSTQSLGTSSYKIKNVYATNYPCGTWNGDAIAVARGGTGATTAAAARSNLGITPANIGAMAVGVTIDGGTWS